MKIVVFILVSSSLSLSVYSQAADRNKTVVERSHQVLIDIAERSFPEIKREKLRVKLFKSESSYFKARFSLCRYATLRKMRHNVYVNPAAFQRMLPDIAFEAVLAHELAHIAYYTRKNRLQLFGLVRLVRGSSTAGFERKADLDAISRGFGKGLIVYRRWLYEQITPEEEISKRKIYFSPDEIGLIIRVLNEKPALIQRWRKRVPLGIEQIKQETGYE